MLNHPFGHDSAGRAPKSLSVYQRNVRTGYRILLIMIAVQLAALLAMIYWLTPVFGASFVANALYQSCQDATHCTLIVDQQPVSVHIANVDAPRLDGSCEAERELAQAALARASELLAAASAIELAEVEPLPGGALSARVLVDSQDLALLLTRSGVARFYIGESAASGWCP